MISKFFLGSPLHEHAEPAQRVLGVAELAPESEDLARLLSGDPEPAVRNAAARRCSSLAALASAWGTETDAGVRATLASALGNALAHTQDSAAAVSLLEADRCTDSIRLDVARLTQDVGRRHLAIAGIRDEEPLLELALAAEHTETRLAAAERVRSPDGLRKLADAAKNKDHGVARLVRQRLDAIKMRQDQDAEADAILAQLEALATQPGAILTAVVELNRRWQALDMSGDTARLERNEAVRRVIQARFDREQEDQRSRARFERRLREWIGTLAPPANPESLQAMSSELAALREEARERGDNAALTSLDEAEQRIATWETDRQALAGAEALVAEAEQLASGESVESAPLLARWQALDRAIRLPALTRRFEAALMQVEQRRLAQAQAKQQQVTAARQRLHGLLHDAELALAAGQLRAARVAADEIKILRPGAGALPKPTTQRLGRLLQQLVEMERWETFGQQSARTQLCERAEALAVQPLDAAKLALEVQKLRNEWKALDQQHAGVPRALWERFDGACEKAYAPAARFFAEQSAQRKEARKRREEFIAVAAEHGPTLLGDVPDWRAVEKWMRETERAWREGDLGSLDPGSWKKIDARFKAALAPVREALSAARESAKAGRQQLIDEVLALSEKALEREAPSQVKTIQARWQEHAKLLPLAQRDERQLWERFRAACNAVFDARHSKRKEEDVRKQESRRGREDLCEQIEQLAMANDREDGDIRRALRDLQDQWKKQSGGSDPAQRDLESRFVKARTSVEKMLSGRARSREAAVWQTLAAKERLCERLDMLVQSGMSGDDAASRTAPANEQWAALPELPAAWERKMAARRDAALHALSGVAETADYLARIGKNAGLRREGLLEIELLLGLESPPDCQTERLALQMKKLRDRFRGGATAGVEGVGERLVDWCALPGIVDERDRLRSEQIFSRVGQAR